MRSVNVVCYERTCGERKEVVEGGSSRGRRDKKRVDGVGSVNAGLLV